MEAGNAKRTGRLVISSGLFEDFCPDIIHMDIVHHTGFLLTGGERRLLLMAVQLMFSTQRAEIEINKRCHLLASLRPGAAVRTGAS